jgi:hypothetical protein
MQQEEPGRRRDRGLQAHQHGEGRGRQPPQREQFQGVRQNGRHQRDREPESDGGRHQQLGPCLRDPQRQTQHGPDAHRQRQPVGLREPPPRPGAEDYVRRPHAARGDRERGADGIEAVEAATAEQAAEQKHPAEREPGPEEVHQPPRGDDGERERPEDLEGDGRAQRNTVGGLVEQHVHGGQGSAEGDDGAPVGAGVPAHLGTADGQQHERGKDEPEGDDADGSGARHEQYGDGGPELHGEHAPDDERDRPKSAPRPGAGRGCRCRVQRDGGLRIGGEWRTRLVHRTKPP